MRQYAESGYTLIVALGSHVYAYSAAWNQGGYVQGYLAALVSRTKVIGES
jgi:hypothetical protein